MILIKPHLTIVNNKLYFSRNPGILFWMIFSLTIIISALICSCLTNGIYLLTTFIFGEIIFGLDTFGQWEELKLDKTENLASVTKSSWCDKLITESLDSYTLKSKLSDIRHVGVSQNMGLFLLPRNGKVMTFDTRGLKRDEVQNMKKHINSFLNLNRMECVESHLLRDSDSDQYLQNLLQKCKGRSTLQNSSPLIENINQNLNASIHQHQSSPSLGAYCKKNLDTFLKKQPYDTDNFESIYLSYAKRRNSVPRR